MLNETELLALMREADIPGMSCALIVDGKLSDLKTLGITDVCMQPSVAVNKNTVFEAASLSKLVVAKIVYELAQREELDLDQSLDKILPLEKAFPHKRRGEKEYYEQLTARMILSHQTGLNMGLDGAFSFLFKPGSEYRYSGAAFFYLQKVIEHLTGKSLETLAKEYVFKPCGMKHSSFLRLKDFHKANGHTVKNEPVNKGDGITVIDGCDLLVIPTTTDIETLRTKLNDLPINSNAAYIRSGKSLFYIDKVNKLCSEVSINQEELEAFDKELKPSTDTRTLSAKETRRIISLTGHTQSEGSAIAPMTLHTTAYDFALFIEACIKDKDLQFHFMPFAPLIYMNKDKWAQAQGVVEADLKKIAWGLGWALQMTDQGTIAFHWGDVGESKAFVAVNMNTRNGIVYFTNSHNGLSIARDITTPFVGNATPLLNYLFKKFGYEHRTAPDWKKKQALGTWHTFAKHDIPDKAEWLSNAVTNKLLTIEHDNKQSPGTLTITCQPKMSLFIKLILNELELYKYEKKKDDTGWIVDATKNAQAEYISLTIKIPDLNAFNEFIRMLAEEDLLPTLQSTPLQTQDQSPTAQNSARPY